MISRKDIQRLIHREPTGRPILSLFLDMSVNEQGKRDYPIFLNKRRAAIAELDSDRPNHHREAIGAAFARIEAWLADEFEESNKGAALYAEIGGDWFEALQFPVPVDHQIAIGETPVVGPLAEIIERYRHHAVMLLDREHLRMVSIYLGQPIHEHEVRGHAYPAPHDVRRGGYSATDYQKRKAEEVRHFFREFGKEVAEFDRRYQPDELILLGTEENVKTFEGFLPKHVQRKIAHTAHAEVDAPISEIIDRLEPYFRERMEREENRIIALLRDRVHQRHLASAGFGDTLEQLQEGKVDTLVVSRDVERTGARCARCGFYLAQDGAEDCPYCGGTTRAGVDLVEAMIRMAEDQEVAIEFADPQALADLRGVGALLRF